MKFIAACLLCPVLAIAQPYRCTDAAGKVTYTDQACAATQRQASVTLSDNSIDTSEARRAALRQREVQEDVSRVLAGEAAQGPVIGTINATGCSRARRDYQMEADSVNKDLHSMRAARHAAERACDAPVAMMPRHAALVSERRGPAYGRGVQR